MMANERIIGVLERALKVIKEPKSDEELYHALRLMSSISKQEAKKVFINMNDSDIAE